MKDSSAIEVLALKIYDRLNPDQDRVIKVSKAECIRMATKQLKSEREVVENDPFSWKPGQRVKLKNLARRPGDVRNGGVIHHHSRTAKEVWYVLWDGFKHPKCVPERFLELE